MAKYSFEQLREKLFERDAEIRSLKGRIMILENRIAYLLEQKNNGRKVSKFKFEDIPTIRSRLRKKNGHL